MCFLRLEKENETANTQSNHLLEMVLITVLCQVSFTPCSGYVRRVTHDEIADVVG
jgi:hypothetical protein